MKPVEEQLALIRRGVEQIVPEDEFRKKLERSVKTGRPLRVKYGIDPTGIDVHLGHTVPLRKLRLFQELGHQAVLIIGNYTALVGDPSGRDQTRAALTQEQVENNARDYLKQVSKVIDITRTEVRPNGDWFSQLGFLDVMRLMGKITVQRMLERDDFTKRLRAGTPISLHECLYPLMQGQDSVEIHADVELGGSEQLFNLMMGRNLQAIMLHPDTKLRTPPSINTLRRIHRLCVRGRTLLSNRAVPPGVNQMETVHALPAPEDFKVFPTPFFLVRNTWLKDYARWIMIALTDAYQHTENAKPLEISTDFAGQIGQYIQRVYVRMATELLQIPLATAQDPAFTITDAQFAAYDPSKWFTSTEMVDTVPDLDNWPTEDTLQPLTDGIPASTLPLLGRWPAGPDTTSAAAQTANQPANTGTFISPPTP